MQCPGPFSLAVTVFLSLSLFRPDVLPLKHARTLRTSRFARILKPLRLLKMTKLGKLLNLAGAVRYLESSLGIPHEVFRMCLTFILTFGVVHLSACFYWIVKVCLGVHVAGAVFSFPAPQRAYYLLACDFSRRSVCVFLSSLSLAVYDDCLFSSRDKLGGRKARALPRRSSSFLPT